MPEARAIQPAGAVVVLDEPLSSRDRAPLHDGPPLLPATVRLLTRLAHQPGVRGVLLTGSASLGRAREDSDDDLEIVVDDDLLGDPHDRVRALAEGGRIAWDAVLVGERELAARVASPRDADHWPYAHAHLLLDPSGRTAGHVRALAAIGGGFLAARLRHALLDLLLATERATACERRGADAERVLITARGARALARLLFGLERRWVPLDHWLADGLARLRDPASAGPLLLAALETGHPASLALAAERVTPSLTRSGLPTPAQRDDLAAVLLDPRRRAERLVHGLA